MNKGLILLMLICFSKLPAQIQYVTTIPPFKEILSAVIGTRGQVTALLPPGSSPHAFELSPSDVRRVENARALFLGSPELDAWVLNFEISPRIELMKLLPPNYILQVTGWENNKNQKNFGIDPHFWTDPLTVKALLPRLVDTLKVLDPAGAAIFRQNAEKFAQQLDALTAQIQTQLVPVKGKAVMLSHPFFQYFFKRFGINLVASIETMPGKEPSARELKNLIKLAQTNGVKAIFDHSQLPDLAAKLIAEGAGIKIHRLDPLGGVPGRKTYAELLLYNTGLLLGALQ